MKQQIIKPRWYLRILLHIVARALILGKKDKIEKINCDNLKWPYILIASHASFIDFATVPPDLMSAFQLIPYQSAEDAVFKALGVE